MNAAVTLRPDEDAAALFGPEDVHLRMLRKALDVRVSARQDAVRISGPAESVQRAVVALEAMRRVLRAEGAITERQVASLLGGSPAGFRTAGVAPKGPGQAAYLGIIRKHDLTFCEGPAGSGKTFLAVAEALAALRAGDCRRIVLARPAVEAGERLGFLPGDVLEKVNPYLRPLFDALGVLLDEAEARRLVARGVVEIVPLAFMRGRTLDRSFVILDEAQNCTVRQMRMFLTRLGPASKAVVAGDPTQTDLPVDGISGLAHACRILRGIPGIGFAELGECDIVRHPLVRRIVAAYEQSEEVSS